MTVVALIILFWIALAAAFTFGWSLRARMQRNTERSR